MPKPLIRGALFFTFGIIVGLTTCAADMAKLQKRLEPHYRAQQPQGSGPFPAVLLVPGCGGVSPARVQTADQLVRGGYAVVFVDYIASRGLKTACRREVSVDEIAQDIRAVSGHLRSLPYIKQTGLGAVGWSLGGAGVLASLAGREQQPVLNAAAAFYPVCAGLRPWKTDIPALLLLGGRDDIAPPGSCEALARKIGSASPVVVQTYPEARHSFDNADLPPTTTYPEFPGKTLGYHKEAAQQAWSDVTAHFNRHLR